jgi:hypothetical protein
MENGECVFFLCVLLKSDTFSAARAQRKHGIHVNTDIWYVFPTQCIYIISLKLS